MKPVATSFKVSLSFLFGGGFNSVEFMHSRKLRLHNPFFLCTCTELTPSSVRDADRKCFISRAPVVVIGVCVNPGITSVFQEESMITLQGQFSPVRSMHNGECKG